MARLGRNLERAAARPGLSIMATEDHLAGTDQQRRRALPGPALEQFVHLMGHTGGYTRDEAIAAIEKEGTLPDMLTFDPASPVLYPNGRVFTDDVIDYRLAFLTQGECPPSGLSPHTDTLTEFPYLGPPHAS